MNFGDRMRKKYRHRIAVVDSIGNLINDFDPEGLEPRNMVIRDGQLWMTENMTRIMRKIISEFIK